MQAHLPADANSMQPCMPICLPMQTPFSRLPLHEFTEFTCTYALILYVNVRTPELQVLVTLERAMQAFKTGMRGRVCQDPASQGQSATHCQAGEEALHAPQD